MNQIKAHIEAIRKIMKKNMVSMQTLKSQGTKSTNK